MKTNNQHILIGSIYIWLIIYVISIIIIESLEIKIELFWKGVLTVLELFLSIRISMKLINR
jgi:hypothetical protein